MIQPNNLDLNGVKDCLPKKDPELKITIRSIPIRETDNRIIPVCEPTLIGNEHKYVNDCLNSNWISSAGKYISLFESRFAEVCGAKYGVSCSNGTTALHLALMVYGIGEGDEVIIPDFTMIATANAVKYTGAQPVFVDAELETWNIDVTKVEAKITGKTKAIIPVHTYGHPCNLDAIQVLAKKYNLIVIEDAAEAHGAEYKGRKIGSISDVTCFSFYANKIISTGEGGMITTNNKEFYEKAIIIRDHAFSEEMHFWHKYLGYNYRMTNLQAAIGLAQVENFDELVNRRIRNARYYMSVLENIPGITFPTQQDQVKNVFWMFSVLINEESKINRDDLRYWLAENGVETRTFFIPMHLQPVYYNQQHDNEYPNAEYLCKHGMYLPSSGNLSTHTIDLIAKLIRDVMV